MKQLFCLIFTLSVLQTQAQISVGVTNYGRYMEFEPSAHFFLNTKMKDQAIAKRTAQFKFIFKDIDSKESIKGVHLSWETKHSVGNTKCDSDQAVITLDKKRVTFKATLDGYYGAIVTVKPQNQYYYDYIVYLKRIDSGHIKPVNK